MLSHRSSARRPGEVRQARRGASSSSSSRRARRGRGRRRRREAPARVRRSPARRRSTASPDTVGGHVEAGGRDRPGRTPGSDSVTAPLNGGATGSPGSSSSRRAWTVGGAPGPARSARRRRRRRSRRTPRPAAPGRRRRRRAPPAGRDGVVADHRGERRAAGRLDDGDAGAAPVDADARRADRAARGRAVDRRRVVERRAAQAPGDGAHDGAAGAVVDGLAEDDPRVRRVVLDADVGRVGRAARRGPSTRRERRVGADRADGAPRTRRRATTRVVPEASRSPQTAMPMPSAEAPTAGRSVAPVPASRAGSTSSGAA